MARPRSLGLGLSRDWRGLSSFRVQGLDLGFRVGDLASGGSRVIRTSKDLG